MENQGARHLTLKLVRQYLAEFGSVNLSQFTTIDEDAARALGNTSDAVFLDGLTAISVTSAQALAKCDGSAVSLDGLVTLSDAVADKLINVKYNLCLNGLTLISDTVAERLAKFKGGYLSLNGLTTLSDRAASALAKRKGMDDALFLQGLTSLTDQAVAELAKHNRLVLKGSIEARVAQCRKGQYTPPGASQAAPALQPTVTLPPPAALPGYPPGYKPNPLVEAMISQGHSTQAQLPAPEKAEKSGSESGRGSLGGLFGGIWNWFSGKDKCPKCGSRQTKRLDTRILEQWQEVQSDYDEALRRQLSTPPQAVFNVRRYEAQSQCDKCGHEWVHRYRDSARA